MVLRGLTMWNVRSCNMEFVWTFYSNDKIGLLKWLSLSLIHFTSPYDQHIYMRDVKCDCTDLTALLEFKVNKALENL